MKVRDSGMPDREYWESLFDVPLILHRMGIKRQIDCLVEFGCGYGTFTIPCASLIRGVVTAFDIEEDMIEATRGRISPAGLANIVLCKRDFVAEGTGLAENAVDYVMLFNILHHLRPLELLAEARRILKPGGRAGLIHWNYDPKTPRGPTMDIRPKPGQMAAWARSVGLTLDANPLIDLPPYHYGLVAKKP